MLRRSLLLVPALLALALAPNPAQAVRPTCAVPDPTTGTCTISIPAPGPSTGPIGNPGSNGGSVPSPCTRFDEPVPCTDPSWGSWSNSLTCYVKLMTPQPDPTSPLWGGHYPEGAVYECVDPFPGQFSPGAVLWLPQAPTNTISPDEAARAVVARMNLRAADIGIVPEDKPGRIGAVGLPVYMWTTPGPATFGPQVLTGSAGGVTITATANVDKIVWDMGDGTRVTCRTPGTPYTAARGFTMSPDCGHKYTQTSADQADNRYPITATSHWVVNWTGPGGSSGQITLDLVSTTSIAVGEIQALVTN